MVGEFEEQGVAVWNMQHDTILVQVVVKNVRQFYLLGDMLLFSYKYKSFVRKHKISHIHRCEMGRFIGNDTQSTRAKRSTRPSHSRIRQVRDCCFLLVQNHSIDDMIYLLTIVEMKIEHIIRVFYKWRVFQLITLIHRQSVSLKNIISVGPFFKRDMLCYQGIGSEYETFVRAFDKDCTNFLKRVGKDRTIGTYKVIVRSRNYVAAFIKSFYKRTDMSMLELTPDFIKEFAAYLTNERGLKNATIWLHCMWLKGVVMRAHYNGLIPRNPFAQFHISPNVKEREYLTEDETKTIMRHEFAPLTLVRDLFIFACFTALSFVNMKELTTDNTLLLLPFHEVWLRPRMRLLLRGRLCVPFLLNSSISMTRGAPQVAPLIV